MNGDGAGAGAGAITIFFLLNLKLLENARELLLNEAILQLILKNSTLSFFLIKFCFILNFIKEI